MNTLYIDENVCCIYGVLNESETVIEYVDCYKPRTMPIEVPLKRTWAQHLVVAVGKVAKGSFIARAIVDAPNSAFKKSRIVLLKEGFGVLAFPKECVRPMSESTAMGSLLFVKQNRQSEPFLIRGEEFVRGEIFVKKYNPEAPQIFILRKPLRGVKMDNEKMFRCDDAVQI